MPDQDIKISSPKEVLQKLLSLYQIDAPLALLLDFDGTLAPIVEDPQKAVPPAEVSDNIAKLTAYIEILGIVSGRELEFLENVFAQYRNINNRIKLFGLYGNHSNDKEFSDTHSQVWMDEQLTESILELLKPVRDQAEIEIKKTGIVIHYRKNPSSERTVLALAGKAARQFNLVLNPGKKVVELTLDGQVNKATVVEYVARSAGAICYLGDDYGDIPAFDAVNSMGKNGLSVAVYSKEAPAELLTKSQLILSDTQAVHELIHMLADHYRKHLGRMFP